MRGWKRRAFLLRGGGSIVVFLAMAWQAAMAQPLAIPWECSSYRDDVQARCITTFNELQQDKLLQLENQLRAQQATVNELKTQIARQEAIAETLQRQASRPTIHLTPIPYPAFLYPSFPVMTLDLRPGVWIWFGHTWALGPSYPSAGMWWGPRPHRSWHWPY